MNSRQRIVSAGIGGLAAAYAQMGRLSRDEAFEQIRERIQAARLDAEQTAAVLADAAAMYVGSERTYADEALRLLADAGADIERACRIHAERAAQTDPLGFIAAQANRPAQPS